MSGPERPTCRTCPYWVWWDDNGVRRVPDDDDLKGDSYEDSECWRYPPLLSVLATDDARDWVHPDVLHDDWCGEHPSMPAYVAALKAGPFCGPERTFDPGGEASGRRRDGTFTHARMAEIILREAGRPMSVPEILSAMRERGHPLPPSANGTVTCAMQYGPLRGGKIVKLGDNNKTRYALKEWDIAVKDDAS